MDRNKFNPPEKGSYQASARSRYPQPTVVNVAAPAAPPAVPAPPPAPVAVDEPRHRLEKEPKQRAPRRERKAPPPGGPEAGKKKSILQLEITKKRVPKTDIMNFSRQLAAFIRAGIPILEAIDTFAQEASNKTFKQTLHEIGVALRAGETFSAAVSVHGRIFPRFYVDMLRGAELTGRLDSVLDQLSRYIEREQEAKRKIRSALTYPALIGVMSVVTVTILSVFVLPRFKSFFQSFHAKLPLPTRMVLATGHFVGNWWWAVLIGLAILVVTILVLLRTAAGRRGFDKVILKVPVIADVVRYAIVERFCRVLSAMVKAGVPLPDAMVVVAESTRNKVYEAALNKVREAMLEGEGLAGPIHRAGIFPAAVTQMVRVGENTGTLDDQLVTAAAFYEQELDYKIKKLTTLFEPAMIIVMGLVVGFVAIALISAMYGIFRQVKV